MKRKVVEKRILKSITALTMTGFAVGAAFTANYAFAKPINTETAAVEARAVVYNAPISLDLLDHITELGKEYGIPVEIILAVIEKESEFDANAIGDEGESFGLMQVLKKHHLPRMEKLNCPDLLDPYQNTTVGVDYLAECLEKNEGNIERALIAYNAGQAGANKHYFSKGIYSNAYSREVLEIAEKMKESVTYMYRTDDPHRDYDRYQAEQQAQLEKLPQCCCCGSDEYIQDDHYFLIEGEIYCEEHLIENFRKDTEDYER